jgi:hypothetical protein
MPAMNRISILAGTALLGATLAIGPAAHAAEHTVDDSAGDAANKGLDFTEVTLNNLDTKIVVTTKFVKDRRGRLIVSIDPRGGTGLRLVSTYRPGGTTKNKLFPGAFSDPGSEQGKDPISCKGFKVTWKPQADLARLQLPSRCLLGGDYGAVRFGYLSELGADTDFGPQSEEGFLTTTDWIPRG